MRYQTELNFILKIREAQGLPSKPQVGKIYSFKKTIERIYPLNLPILLVDDDYNVYGKCAVIEFTVNKGIISGKYKILSLFDKEKREIFTADLLESVQQAKELSNYSN